MFARVVAFWPLAEQSGRSDGSLHILLIRRSREETARVCFNLMRSFSDARSVFDEAVASLKLACGNLLRFLSEA